MTFFFLRRVLVPGQIELRLRSSAWEKKALDLSPPAGRSVSLHQSLKMVQMIIALKNQENGNNDCLVVLL